MRPMNRYGFAHLIERPSVGALVHGLRTGLGLPCLEWGLCAPSDCMEFGSVGHFSLVLFSQEVQLQEKM